MSTPARPPAQSGPANLRALSIVIGSALAVALLIGVVGGSEAGDEVAADTTTASDEPNPTPASTEAPEASDQAATTTPVEATETTLASTNTQAPEGSDTTAPSAPLQGLALEPVVDGLSQPTYAVSPPGDPRLFVTERIGVIRIVGEDGDTEVFADLSDLVLANGIEQGLLGLAFHPEFASNGRFFTYFTNKSAQRQLSEFTVSADDANRGDKDSVKVLFALSQPPNSVDIRHYGGMLMFGPDGYLYASLGDGANASEQGQDPNSMFGTIVRLDVDSGDPYGIPADNPFVSGGGAPEVFIYGLRNPWRFSVDPVDELLYIGDVGQDVYEEINVVPLSGGGTNLGWADMEGTRCFLLRDCEPTDYTAPTLTYNRDDGCSVTGGHVYRGAAIPEMHGTYFYTDWCFGWIRSFEFENGSVTAERDWSDEIGPVPQFNAFGVDADGELYVVSHSGSISKIVPIRG